MRVLVLLAVLSLAAARSSPLDVRYDYQNLNDFKILELFKEFIQEFKREYHSTMGFFQRVKAFRANLHTVQALQKADPTAHYSHMTPFMDVTPEQFKKERCGLLTPDETDVREKNYAKINAVALPESFDWRSKGVVNPPKDQAQCGSCWAFSTVANIESVYKVQGGGELISLSEQELVDCSSRDNGCNGGLPDRAFTDLIGHNGFFRQSPGFGLVLESDYGYHATAGSCAKDNYVAKVFIDSYKDISKDEDEIAQAVMQYGVLAIGINAGPMQMYRGGIANPPNCDPRGLDHAVNIVGFGSENGQKYWTIRNSWGAGWGEDGYYRLIRGEGRCGMNLSVSTAIINKKQEDILV